MITYSQKTGQIGIRNTLIGIGYSGHAEGLDDPDMEAVVAIGPIPRGEWKIDRWLEKHGTKGPIVARLSPVGHNAHGRSGFLIHGDNSSLNHTASHGCIISSRAIRDALRASGVTQLLVTT